jgi:hypothetical protein
VTLKAGQTATLRVQVQRSHFDGAIVLSPTAGLPGITLSGYIGPNADNAEVTVRADTNAKLGDAVLTIRAEAEGLPAREVTLPLTIEPAYWQPNWRKAPGAEVVIDARQRRHYSEIDVMVGDIPVRFVLVAQEQGGIEDTPTFYIMRNKVWNDLYARFAAAEPAKAGDTWTKGGQAVRNMEIVDLGNQDGQLPALRMTAMQAYEFAQWIGGKLPTIRQWDKASGYYKKDRGKGPFRVPAGRVEGPEGPNWLPGEIALNREEHGPMHVGEATYDKSPDPYQCCDMAGNGCEWTRDLAGATPRTLPLAKPSGEDNVILRGKRYSARKPWLFSNVDDGELGAWNYLKPGPEFGFRVVIELE